MSLSEETRIEISWELYGINTDLDMALLCFDDLQDKYFGKPAAQIPQPEYAKIQAGLHCIRKLLIKAKVDLSLLSGDEDPMIAAYITERESAIAQYKEIIGASNDNVVKQPDGE